MDDKIAVVSQNPFSVVVAFDIGGPLTGFGEVRPNGVADGLNLTRVVARADDEMIGKRSELAKVQDTNVRSLPGFGGTNGYQPGWNWVRGFWQVTPPLS